MKCSCNNNLIIQFLDDKLYIQTCNNSQNFIPKYQGLPEPINEGNEENNQIVRFMQQFSNKNLDQNSFKQIFEFNANSQSHFKMPIDNDNNFRTMSSQQPIINSCICQHHQKKQKKLKQKAKQPPPKPTIEKTQENSDSKASQKQSKAHSQVNEDIRIFEDKIRSYTSEIDESNKKSLKLPQEWIKRLGTQKKKK
ncbi:unnamed protein product (macronuclear) [Paramecium tetraurelia]|uniref:Uncharacterized protein n=1 Tax=Paramecium tetraurelia TaxID=5888 RepID=A0D103_PARTE|nr:uncharacterized protein GSPATT00012272001 [Paramecium tetraurelia]CAK76720.1 unnamed protein product [Paramecium tetraurelia]|eukprot:XP_001444117.1 hypothetical protein (macronuclear) [Paramecium tetraurelia strain d4-2]